MTMNSDDAAPLKLQSPVAALPIAQRETIR
jgi:hypothetical protein